MAFFLPKNLFSFVQHIILYIHIFSHKISENPFRIRYSSCSTGRLRPDPTIGSRFGTRDPTILDLDQTCAGHRPGRPVQATGPRPGLCRPVQAGSSSEACAGCAGSDLCRPKCVPYPQCRVSKVRKM